jgi:hypothetical protein
MKQMILLLVIFCFAAIARAEQKELLQLDSAFANGDYEKTELLAMRILQSPDSLPKNDRARVNLTAGYALIMLNRERDARTFFTQALDAVPDLTLDPSIVSPKFKVVFDEVKIERERKLQAQKQHSTELQTARFSSGPSRNALLLNLAIPGLGQVVEGQKTRGAIYTGLQVVSVVWFVKSLSDMNSSRKDYLRSAGDANTIASRYNRYNQDYRMAWASGIVSGLVYLAAQTDLILYQPRTGEPVKLTVTSGSKLGLAVSW